MAAAVTPASGGTHRGLVCAACGRRRAHGADVLALWRRQLVREPPNAAMHLLRCLRGRPREARAYIQSENEAV